MDDERKKALKEEVDHLKENKFIRDAYYPEWIDNPVLVPKPNGKWQTYIDYSDLNKACPKHYFSLPRIDQLVDATTGYETMSFMDAYSGFNQINMHPSDQEHISFVTDKGLYCCSVMMFELKNAGATYQRLVNIMFTEQIRVNMEVYVDDMLIKTKYQKDHVKDLSKCFTILRKYNMKLNRQKCLFRVSSRKFLGYIVNARCIEANPEKI